MTAHSSPSRQTSTSLLLRVRLLDREAWIRLTRVYGPLVYGWARRAGLQDSDAADVAQEVFRRVAAHIHRFQRSTPSDSFRGWLWTITRNQVRDHFRRAGKEPRAAGGTDAQIEFKMLVESLDASTSNDCRGEVGSIYRRALEVMKDEFREPTWKAFWRVAVDGQAPVQVAEELGMSVWAVYQAKSRVLRRLRQEFAELEEFQDASVQP